MRARPVSETMFELVGSLILAVVVACFATSYNTLPVLVTLSIGVLSGFMAVTYGDQLAYILAATHSIFMKAGDRLIFGCVHYTSGKENQCRDALSYIVTIVTGIVYFVIIPYLAIRLAGYRIKKAK